MYVTLRKAPGRRAAKVERRRRLYEEEEGNDGNEYGQSKGGKLRLTACEGNAYYDDGDAEMDKVLKAVCHDDEMVVM